MKSICIFCGSNKGASSKYQQLTWELGRLLAKKKIKLVYGGASVGLMNVLADSVITHSGEVIGVLPGMCQRK